MLKTNLILITLLSFFMMSSCSDNSKDKKVDSKKSSISKKQTFAKDMKLNAHSQYLTDTARFLAGRNVSSKSKLKRLSNLPEYKNYQKMINASWKVYIQKNASKITKWRKKHLENQCSNTIFYPFSGPDNLNVIQFFPNASSYTMMALEPTGKIPDPLHMTAGQNPIDNLYYIPKTVQSLVGFSFFRTKSMAIDIGRKDFSGINGILMFFLGRLDFEILDIFYIRIDKNGRVVKIGSKVPQGVHSDGSSIIFRKKKGASIKKIVFIRGDISDKNLALRSNIRNFFKNIPNGITTQLKAASYLMYRSSFDAIRSTILGKSKCILTDSSGIPFHFMNNGFWDVNLYGRYNRPISLFSSRFQPDLFVAMKKKKPEVFHFSYGYVFGNGRSHIILARRNAKNKFVAPTFDHSNEVGISSIYLGNGLFQVRHRYSTSSITP